jgi:hypothetical protein
MTSKIINIPLAADIIDYASNYLLDAGPETAFLSGGKRPFLFIKKSLAQKKQKAFYPPGFLSVDDFIEQAALKENGRSKICDMEAAYILYLIIQEKTPSLLKGKKTFAEFFAWALEILVFIENLNLENVSAASMKNLKANAEIGFDVPQNINDLLKNIFMIQDFFCAKLDEKKQTTRGMSFLKAAKMDVKITTQGFDEIVLFTPFYLHKTELEFFKNIFDAGKLTVILRGDPKEYDSLKKIYEYFNQPLSNVKKSETDFSEIDFEIYSAFDDQSQAVIIKNILNDLPPKQLDKTLIAAADPFLLSPLIAEVSRVNMDFNVSAGYPISKTALFDLVKSILRSQTSKRGQNYYLKDIMKVLSNPLVKNMRFFASSSLTRAVVHGIEQSFSDDALSGRAFICLKEICSNESILKKVSEITAQLGEYVNVQKLEKIISDILKTLFSDWEDIFRLDYFSQTLISFLNKTLKLSIVDSYELNSQSAEVLIETARELQEGEVSKQEFSYEDIINIFLDAVKNKKIALSGSPLKGLQILGLLEARNLSFENVFIAGLTDSALPAISKTSPLIPKEAAYSLGIEMSKKDYEIQKYHFDGLISGAKKVYLVYPENEKDERSRFVEKLIWEKQLRHKDLNAVKISSLFIQTLGVSGNKKKKYIKTQEIKNYLSKITYSYSSVDIYLRCKLRFYFRYVLSLKEQDEIGREGSSEAIGKFLHAFLQNIFYGGFERSKVSDKNFIANSLKFLDESFENFAPLKLRDDAFIIKKVLSFRVKNLLETESQRNIKRVFGCEKPYQSFIKTPSRQYAVRCCIDRIDETDEGYVLLDYKTGASPKYADAQNFYEIFGKDFDAQNFNSQSIKKIIPSFQLPLYKYIFQANENKKVSDCLIYTVRDAQLQSFLKNPKDLDFDEFCNDLMKVFGYILDEINSGQYFEFDGENFDECKNCPFFYICR